MIAHVVNRCYYPISVPPNCPCFFNLKLKVYLRWIHNFEYFKSFILPHFDYCSSLFVYFSITLISWIESLFNSVVFRLFKIDLKPLTLHEQYSLLSEMNILPFRFRFFYRFSTFCFKIMNSIYLDNIKTRVCVIFLLLHDHRGPPV